MARLRSKRLVGLAITTAAIASCLIATSAADASAIVQVDCPNPGVTIQTSDDYPIACYDGGPGKLSTWQIGSGSVKSSWNHGYVDYEDRNGNPHTSIFENDGVTYGYVDTFCVTTSVTING